MEDLLVEIKEDLEHIVYIIKSIGVVEFSLLVFGLIIFVLTLAGIIMACTI